MNKNSNTYIIIYSVVMVVIVALLLAVAALSLQPLQNKNILGEKQNAIMKALGEEGSYDETVKAYAVDKQGNVITTVSGDDALQMLFSLRDAFAKGQYPVFEDIKSGAYVVPVIGKGLWDDIWGYVALDSDMSTIKGVVFDHKGETPGLGAEIKTDKFQNEFMGKTIYDNGNLVSIEVVKGGAPDDAPHAVDALTGATKTCLGLQHMLKDCLTSYDPFFKQTLAARQPATVAQPVEPNQENVESNE